MEILEECSRINKNIYWRRCNKVLFCVMVSDSVSRGFLFICFNTEVKSLAVAMIMLVEVAFGMMSLWGNQETVCPMRTELVKGIQI